MPYAFDLTTLRCNSSRLPSFFLFQHIPAHIQTIPFFKNFPAVLICIGDILLKQVLPISLFDIIISNNKTEIGESLEVMNEVQQD
jgi:selenophosphate synthetase-related protein